MGFDEYQEKVKKYDLFDDSRVDNLAEPAFSEKVLGLVGEAGETADKVKKIIRDKKGVASDEDKDAIKKEMGDVLWYIANVSRYLGFDLSDVAKTNIDKLESRYQRNKLHGAGDERWSMNDYNLDYDQGYEDAVFGEDEKATTNADYQSGYIDGLRAREEQEAADSELPDDHSSDDDNDYINDEDEDGSIDFDLDD